MHGVYICSKNEALSDGVRREDEPCLPVLTQMLMYAAMLAMVQVMGVQLPEQFPRMTYAQAMDRYGCDKPDVRYELHMQNVTDIVQGCSLRYSLDPTQISNEHGVHHTPCRLLDTASTFDRWASSLCLPSVK